MARLSPAALNILQKLNNGATLNRTKNSRYYNAGSWLQYELPGNLVEDEEVSSRTVTSLENKGYLLYVYNRRDPDQWSYELTEAGLEALNA